MLHWRRRAIEGDEFWISCKRLKLLRKAGRLQLIQNSVPSVARRRQCDIRIGCYFKCCYKYIILISWNLIWMAKLKFKSLALNTAIVGLWIFHLSLPIHQNVFHPVLGKIFHDLGWYFPAVAGCNFRYFPIYFWVLHR